MYSFGCLYNLGRALTVDVIQVIHTRHIGQSMSTIFVFVCTVERPDDQISILIVPTPSHHHHIYLILSASHFSYDPQIDHEYMSL